MNKSIISYWAVNERGNLSDAWVFDDERQILAYLSEVYKDGLHSQFHSVTKSGIAMNMAIAYDFRPWLKTVLVKQHEEWREYLAPNKTSLRRCLTSFGTIQKMVYI